MRKTNTGTYNSQWIVNFYFSQLESIVFIKNKIFDLNRFNESLGQNSLNAGTFYVAEQSSEHLTYKDFSSAESKGNVTHSSLTLLKYSGLASFLGIIQYSIFPKDAS